MLGLDFDSSGWPLGDPLPRRESVSGRRPAVNVRDLAVANGLFLSEGGERRVRCELVWRRAPENWGYAVFAGLNDAAAFMRDLYFTTEDLHTLSGMRFFNEGFLDYLAQYRFQGTVKAVPEGTIVFPGEPLLTVEGSLMDVQLLESALCSMIGRSSFIATKARRLVQAAGGHAVFVHDCCSGLTPEAAASCRQAAFIGGVKCLDASDPSGKPGQGVAGVPMTRNWVLAHGDEYRAFRRFAEIYPENCCVLADTVDALESGIPNAIRVDREVLRPMGRRLAWVVLGADDLFWVSRKARNMLDEAGMADCGIIASGLTGEEDIGSAVRQGVCVDAFDAGTAPVGQGGRLDLAWRLADEPSEEHPLSMDEAWLKHPASRLQCLYRIYDGQGLAAADLVAAENSVPAGVLKELTCMEKASPWRRETFRGCTARPLFETVAEGGRVSFAARSPESVRAAVSHQLNCEMRPDETRLEDPRPHRIVVSPEESRAREKNLEKCL